MKLTNTTTLFLFFALIFSAQGQVCNINVAELTSQEDVDNFQSNYPGCSTINGNVEVSGPDITNLNGLNNITSIHGQLLIHDTPNLFTLTGLEELHNADIIVIQRTGLNDLTGLNGLDSVGFIFAIESNPRLTNLTGLNALNYVFGLAITNNILLESLNGLDALSRAQTLAVDYNPLVINLTGMPALASLNDLYVGNNDNIIDLKGLENITDLGNVRILNNPLLTSLQGLENLETSKDLYISGNPSLASLNGLESLNYISRSIKITNNATLSSISSLQNLTGVSSDFYISNNDALANLSGLESLTFIDDSLYISGNQNLENLSGIALVNYIGRLIITFNNNLSECSVMSVCDHLSFGGINNIGGNSNGCYNAKQVLTGCTVDTEDPASAVIISIYPNPASDRISIAGIALSDNNYSITDSYGRNINYSKISANTIDISGQLNGNYYFIIQIGTNRIIKRIVKL